MTEFFENRRVMMGIKSVLKKVRYHFRSNTHIELMSEKEMAIKSRPYSNKLAIQDTCVKDDNIIHIDNMQIKTAARECVIKELVSSGEYTTDRVLVIMNPFGYVPMSAMAIFRTKKPCKTRMWVQCDKKSRIIGELPASCDHRVPIIGCFAGAKNNIYIQLIYSGGFRKTLKFSLEMEPLPDEMKGMVKVIESNDKPAYPFYYVSGVDSWFPYIFDFRGRIRYYILKPGKNYGVFPMSGGMMFHSDRGVLTPGFGVPHSTFVHEMDILGRVRKTLHIDTGLHHDAVEMSPGGNFLIATSTLVKYCEDVVAEIDRNTGMIVRSIEMDDVVNDESVKDSPDWAHLNTVSYCADDNSVIVCLRNLHSIIKLDWGTGGIKWMLGDPEFWGDSPMARYLLKPSGDNIRWFYQAHSSFQVNSRPDDADGVVRIAIYDNHWQSRRKTDNFDNDPKSFGLIYEVNENDNTVRLLEQYESRKSSVRSNIVYAEDRDRVLLMSGCLNEAYKKCRGLIYDYRKSDGKLVNLYGITKQCYRVYPYQIDYKSISEPVEYNTKEFGKIKPPVSIAPIDVSMAEKLPPSDRGNDGTEVEAVLELIVSREFPKKETKTRAEKEREWDDMRQGKTWAELDHTGRIGRTTFKLTGDMLFLYAVDHIVSYLYIVGKNNTYMVDYTNTRQDIPALFYNYSYHMAVPLDSLEEDSYKLYVKCFDTLYDTEKCFVIDRQEDNNE